MIVIVDLTNYILSWGSCVSGIGQRRLKGNIATQTDFWELIDNTTFWWQDLIDIKTWPLSVWDIGG